MEQATLYGPDKSDSDMRDRILELAAQYELPLEEDGFTLERVDNHTIVDGGYSMPIEVFPGYERGWPFRFHVDTFAIKSGR